MATLAALRPPEQRVILNVSWETYERLLAEHPDSAGPRFTYNEGTLEIMVLSSQHEQPNRTLAALVEVLAEEFGMDVRRLGSTTFKRAELLKGFEPDSAFYIGPSAARGRQIGADVDLPPDLALEVDVSSASLDRFPIYAAFGVPEVWRFDGARVAFWRLEGGRYVEATSSVALPTLTAAVATQFLEQSRNTRSTEWLRQVREWARQQR